MARCFTFTFVVILSLLFPLIPAQSCDVDVPAQTTIIATLANMSLVSSGFYNFPSLITESSPVPTAQWATYAYSNTLFTVNIPQPPPTIILTITPNVPLVYTTEFQTVTVTLPSSTGTALNASSSAVTTSTHPEAAQKTTITVRSTLTSNVLQSLNATSVTSLLVQPTSSSSSTTIASSASSTSKTPNSSSPSNTLVASSISSSRSISSASSASSTAPSSVVTVSATLFRPNSTQATSTHLTTAPVSVCFDTNHERPAPCSTTTAVGYPGASTVYLGSGSFTRTPTFFAVALLLFTLAFLHL